MKTFFKNGHQFHLQEHVYKFDKSYINVSKSKVIESDGDIIMNFAIQAIKSLSSVTYRFRMYGAEINSKQYRLEADQTFNMCRVTSVSSNILLKIIYDMMFKSTNLSINCPIKLVKFK